jgi:ribosomal protein L37AE/L43A
VPSDLLHHRERTVGKYGDWYSERCRERKEPADEVPLSQCPRCKVLQLDHDGFGVLLCASCGYCAHASITDGVCDFCGKLTAQPLEKEHGPHG